jgi:hypothetical protein
MLTSYKMWLCLTKRTHTTTQMIQAQWAEDNNVLLGDLELGCSPDINGVNLLVHLLVVEQFVAIEGTRHESAFQPVPVVVKLLVATF